jgi:hypothetical protein
MVETLGIKTWDWTISRFQSQTSAHMEMRHCRYAVASTILGSILVCATVYSPPQARSRFEWDVIFFRTVFSPQIFFSEIVEELQDLGLMT